MMNHEETNDWAACFVSKLQACEISIKVKNTAKNGNGKKKREKNLKSLKRSTKNNDTSLYQHYWCL